MASIDPGSCMVSSHFGCGSQIGTDDLRVMSRNGQLFAISAPFYFLIGTSFVLRLMSNSG
jgi:hypothetical protein